MLDDDFDLRDYLEILRRHRVIVLAVMLAFIAGGALYSFVQPARYRAEAEILITRTQIPTTLATSSAAAGRTLERELNNEVKLAQSDAVRARTVELNQGPVDVRVRTESDNDTLTFAAVADTAEGSARAANAAAEAFLELRLQFFTDSYLQAKTVLETQLAETRTEIDRLEAEIAATASSSARRTIQTQLDANRDTEARLIADLSGLQIAGQLNENGLAQINRSAVPPASPFSPDWTRNLLLAAIGGLLAGVAAAFVVDALQDHIRNRSDLTRSSGLPVLATVPNVRSRRKGLGYLATQGGSAQARESFRSLRSSIALVDADSPRRVILVTSPNPSEGKTTTAVNMAASFAMANKRVLLIDADLRRPACHNQVGVHNRQGLSDYLLDREFNIIWEQQSGKRLFEFLPAGDANSQAVEALTQGKLKEFLETFRYSYDLVLIDSPPVLPVSDAQAMAPLCDGVVLLAMAHQTTNDAVSQAVELLDRSDAVLLGTVLTNIEERGYASAYGQH